MPVVDEVATGGLQRDFGLSTDRQIAFFSGSQEPHFTPLAPSNRIVFLSDHSYLK